MDRASRSRPKNEAYEAVAGSDPELDSDEGTVIPTALSSGSRSLGRRRPCTVASTLWLFTRIVLTTASAIAWAASLWLTHLASRELAQARSLIPDLSSNIAHLNNSRPSACGAADTASSHPGVLTTGFIKGATLPVPGYGLVYNTSYCNGWADPSGAKARGCVLDPSQGGWVHRLCHDPALLDEWMSLPDFGWYLDPKRKQRIPQDRVWAADIPGGVRTPLYTAWDFHIEHCKFVMRLRIKNGMRRTTGLGYLPLDPGHMNHCIHLMTEINTPEKKSRELTKVVLGEFGGGTEGFGLAGECYMPAVCQYRPD